MANGTTETAGSWASGKTLLKIGVGILAAAVAGYAYLEAQSGGDEPPIRVKNGTIELEIYNSNRTWTGAGTNWRFNAGTRLHTDYTMDIRPKNGGTCTGPTRAKGPSFKVTYVEGNNTAEITATIDPSNKKTRVTSTQRLQRSPNGKTLSYGVKGQGHISKIEIGQTSCTFPEADDLDDATASDF